MTHKRILCIALLFSIIFTSCHKEDLTQDSNEEFYKRELTSRLKRNQQTSQTKKADAVINVGNFKTYKEAYEALKPLFEGITVTASTPAKVVSSPQSKVTTSSDDDPEPEPFIDVNYTATPYNTAVISGTFTTGTLTASFGIDFKIRYIHNSNTNGWDGTVILNKISEVKFAYSGIGSAKSGLVGTFYGRSCRTSIQIEGSLGGVPFSLYVNAHFTYNITIPDHPSGSPTVPTTLSAQAS